MTIDVDPPFTSGQNYVVENGVASLLNLLNKFKIKATFFIPALVAMNFPRIVKEIVKQHHEIGCHGYNHALLEASLNLNKKIKMVKTATEVIECVSGVRPLGFRAPYFKVDRNYWIALQKNDFVYDSSCVSFPSLYKFNGKFPRLRPFFIQIYAKKDESSLLEIPVSANPILPFPLGGIWLRIFGLKWAKVGIKMNMFFETPIVFYIHPKDVIAFESTGLPWYYYVNTLHCMGMLKEIIMYVKSTGTKFLTAIELAERYLDKIVY